MIDIVMSPCCMNKDQLIDGVVSILLAPMIHSIAVALCDNSSQKVTVSS